ncbi:MAG TPA: C40 family peptidase [Candidatus Mediterraneibacter norwichensis]|nr:C40 family peptidase [Candidatus Mediterraneibacter norwichensis]HJB45889.1 C40 family peptidase [Candidatus Mediterraneibacter surreyensis]
MRYRKVCSAFLATALVCSLAVVPALAEPANSLDSLQEEKDNLEGRKSEAQSELNSLQVQLEALLSKTAELEDKLIDTGQQISQAKDDLAAAEDKRQSQYDAMKLRIKYIYESGGDVTALEKILTSGDITSMLTQAEYSQKVHEYDREQLQAYAETVQEIEDLQDTLETKMANLQDLESEYQTQQEELNTTIASKQDEISDLDGMLQEAARKVVEEQERQAREEAQAAAADDERDEVSDSTSKGNASDTDSGTTSNNTSDNSNGADSENTNAGSSGNNSSSDTPDYDSSTGSSIVARAQGKIGCAYEWGAAGPSTFDCSGLVSYCLTGSYVHTWSTTDFMSWTRVSNPQPGDICTSATHCGIYIGNGMMIHAPHTGDVVKVGPVQSSMVYVRY